MSYVGRSPGVDVQAGDVLVTWAWVPLVQAFDPTLFVPPAGWGMLGWSQYDLGQGLPAGQNGPKAVVWIGRTASGPTQDAWVPAAYAGSPLQVWGAFVFRGETNVVDVKTVARRGHMLQGNNTVTSPVGWSPAGSGLALRTLRVIPGLGVDVTDPSSLVEEDVVSVAQSISSPRAWAVTARTSVQWSDGSTTWIPDGDFGMLASTVSLDESAPSPMRPWWTSAMGGIANTAQKSWRVMWAYNAGLVGAQTAYEIEMTLDGVARYWNASTASFQAGEAWNAIAGKDVVFPAGLVANGKTIGLRVRTRGTLNTNPSPWSAVATINTANSPLAGVAVVGLDVAAGVLADMTPTIVPSGQPSPGTAMVAYDVQLLDGAGRVLAALSRNSASGQPPTYEAWSPELVLTNHAAYVARARIAQTGGEWSEWAEQSFTVEVVTPGRPQVTASPTRHEGSGMPGLLVSAAWQWETDVFDWVSTPTTMLLQRRDGPGGAWGTIATATPTVGTATWTWVDYGAPMGIEVAYRVRASAASPDGGVLIGPWGESAPVTLAPEGSWLMPYGYPELAARLELVDEGDWDVDPRASATATISRRDWLVSSGVALDEAASWTVRTWDEASRRALVEMLTGGHLLRLTRCAERGRDGAWFRPSDTWMRVSGKVGIARGPGGPYGLRLVSWPWVAQPPPVDYSDGV